MPSETAKKIAMEHLAEEPRAKLVAASPEIAELCEQLISELRESQELSAELQAENAQLANQVLELESNVAKMLLNVSLGNAVLNTINDAILTITDQGFVREANLSAARVFDRDQWTLPGEHISDLLGSKHGPVDVKRFFLPPEEGGVVGIRHECAGLGVEGRLLPLEVGTSLLQDDGGTLAVLVVRDLTELKEKERKVAELNDALISASRQAGMAEIATGVLHNVGNVLNSVNVSASLIKEAAENGSTRRLQLICNLLDEQEDLGAFFSSDPRATKVLPFLHGVIEKLDECRQQLLDETVNMTDRISHIKVIVGKQQEHAKTVTVVEVLDMVEVLDDAITLAADGFASNGVTLENEALDEAMVEMDKHKVVQILVNLLKNAAQAAAQGGADSPMVWVSVACDDGRASVTVRDNGVGISPEHLSKIFTHGFTTKKEGHGFGLHNSGNAAQEMNGGLSVHSEGLGHGAEFTLWLPLYEGKQDDNA